MSMIYLKSKALLTIPEDDGPNALLRYLESNQAHRINRDRMNVKEKHTIVEKWPFRPRLMPGQCGALVELEVMMSSVTLGLARYVEYKSILP